jgi:hypothetical protein
MDITVSRLNERMALRVPSELPLGLVFIVGQVQAIRPYGPDPEEVALQLADGEHSLPCRLPHQVAEEMQLVGEERVRAGGQLIFDTREARYYLLARDIEVLPSQAPSDEDAAPRTLVAGPPAPSDGRLAAGELPPWVRQLAPPEVQSELYVDAVPTEADVKHEPDDESASLPPGLIEYLSQAIDSDQDIELTPSLFHELIERYEARPPVRSAIAPGADESALAAYDTVYEVGVDDIHSTPDEAGWPDEDAVPLPVVAMDAEGEATSVDDSQNEKIEKSKQPASSQGRQMLLLVAGVFALFFFILLVFVIIALALGYTPFLVP